MRKAVKFLHTLAACGMIGALSGYLALLRWGPQDTPAQLAATRQGIAILCDYILIPSLGVVLVSGFISMLVHKPYMNKGWVWAKALTTIGIFESTMVVVNSKSTEGVAIAMKIARGEADLSAMGEIFDREGGAIAVVLTLAVLNVLVGVWRPKLDKLMYRPS